MQLAARKVLESGSPQGQLENVIVVQKLMSPVPKSVVDYELRLVDIHTRHESICYSPDVFLAEWGSSGLAEAQQNPKIGSRSSDNPPRLQDAIAFQEHPPAFAPGDMLDQVLAEDVVEQRVVKGEGVRNIEVHHFI